MRSAKRIVSAMASGAARNSRAISAGCFRCRSALASSRLPAVVQRHMFANAGDDILQLALLGHVIERVIDRDQRHMMPMRKQVQLRAISCVRFCHRASKPQAIPVRRFRGQLLQHIPAELHIPAAERVRRHQDQQQSVLPGEEIVQT